MTPNDPPSPAIGVRCGFDEVVRALKAGYGARRAGYSDGDWITASGGRLTFHFCGGQSRILQLYIDDILADDWTICGPNGEP